MSNLISHHLIFEGSELSGKSWAMSQIYDFLEPKYNQNKVVLDGCHWFNCDVGVYGTKYGKKVIERYVDIFSTLKERNLLVEKLHLSDIIYNRLYNQAEIDYKQIETELKKLNFKIILLIFPEDKELIGQRIKDRLNLYPHYERILRSPTWYIKLQREYVKEVKKTNLPCLKIKVVDFPDHNMIEKILKWIGEK